MTKPNGIISLITDFGYHDEYVGVMKGAILRTCPETRIVDICHEIPPHDVVRASRMLAASYPYFPSGTIHLIVVDPGVGLDRHILVLEAAGHLFIAPDNGILTPLLSSSRLSGCYRLIISTKTTSSCTFHGRDIMAPAAARLAAGMTPRKLATAIPAEECATIIMPSARIEDDCLIGEVVAIDHFGNIATSIGKEHLFSMRDSVEVCLGETVIRNIHATFGEVAAGFPVALINSRGDLEIGINMGNAAVILNCRVGDKVVVRSCKPS